MPDITATSRGAHELLLVVAVAAAVFGVANGHLAVLEAHPTSRVVPREHTALVHAEDGVTDLADRSVATTPQEDGIPPPPMNPPGAGDAPFVGTCPSWHNPDRDLRFVLTNMAIQLRRSAQERPAKHFVAPPKQFAPLTDYVVSDQSSLAIDDASAAHAVDLSPSSAAQPIRPVC